MPRAQSATVMKVTTQMTERQAMESSNGQAATSTKVSTKKTKETAMEKCTGLMEVATRVNGLKEFSMAMVRCSSLMEPKERAILKTTCTRLKSKSAMSSNLMQTRISNKFSKK